MTSAGDKSMEHDEAMEKVVDFLRKANDATDALDWDQDLIELRILDSLAFVEFLVLLEEVTGAPVDPGTIDVENFRTLNRIHALIGGAGRAQ
ncbi:phosphopantetheine-binding protein [Streptomyces sp. NPDC001678]|uniref:phosphopantetheine-binding protein n=1 Tax=Streptomyces sp. NPDC001678 TaxID=3364599 RepID=UPI0036888F1D